MTQYTEKDLTPWFPADVAPIHAGVYQTKAKSDGKYKFYQYFDGHAWRQSERNPMDAANNGPAYSSWQNVQWRGLRFDPSEVTK